MQFGFELQHTYKKARAGVIHTAHGDIETPIFMPVGTQGTIKGLTNEHILQTNAEIILGNTYHLFLRPGIDVFRQIGGLHNFMNWHKPILTDSGGYQIASLTKLRKVKEEGATFQSHIDGSKQFLSPEISTEMQNALDSDITMVLDDCTPYDNPKKREQAMYRSLRWAERSRKAFIQREGYGQFAIVQGGPNKELRQECAEELVKMNFEGYAVGGVTGYHDTLFATLDFTLPFLPANKPRYVMGIGKPVDIVGAIARGSDMSDCVLPARYARHGVCFTREGELKLREAKYELDTQPLDKNCNCYACKNHTRAYIHHLWKADEMLACTLMTLHNITYYLDLVKYCRNEILNDTFEFDKTCKEFGIVL